jgi:hypothetical protein
MLQENVNRRSIRGENMKNCLRIFTASAGIVLGLGLIGMTFTYVIHSYEEKDFGPAIVVTLVISVILAWIIVDTYYSRSPLEERPCRRLGSPVTSQTSISDPLMYNDEDSRKNDDADTAEM